MLSSVYDTLPAVGAVGTPVNAGLLNGAFAVNPLLLAELAAATTSPTNLVVAILVERSDKSAITDDVGVPVNAGLAMFALN